MTQEINKTCRKDGTLVQHVTTEEGVEGRPVTRSESTEGMYRQAISATAGFGLRRRTVRNVWTTCWKIWCWLIWISTCCHHVTCSNHLGQSDLACQGASTSAGSKFPDVWCRLVRSEVENLKLEKHASTECRFFWTSQLWDVAFFPQSAWSLLESHLIPKKRAGRWFIYWQLPWIPCLLLKGCFHPIGVPGGWFQSSMFLIISLISDKDSVIPCVQPDRSHGFWLVWLPTSLATSTRGERLPRRVLAFLTWPPWHRCSRLYNVIPSGNLT